MTPRDFTHAQIALLSWAVRDVISRRRLDGRAGWSTMRALEALDRLLATTSVCGSESVTPPQELRTDDLIDSKTAARILGCSREWIGRIAFDLDGRKVSGRWVFERQAVVEYADLKGVEDDGNRVPRIGGRAVPSRAA
jgi:hypothetical protein